jgi:hypothetical protein
MFEMINVVIEDIAFVIILILCLYGLASCLRHTKTIPGADLVVIGLLFYGMSVVFSLGTTGFASGFFENFSRVSILDQHSYLYFLSILPRPALILVIVGLFRMAAAVKE